MRFLNIDARGMDSSLIATDALDLSPDDLAKAAAAPVGTETVRRDGSRWRKVKPDYWRQVHDGDATAAQADDEPSGQQPAQ